MSKFFRKLLMGGGIVTIYISAGLVPVSAEERPEVPFLAESVASGNLPPVEARLPTNPKEIEPYERIGSYGGTLRRALRSEADDYVGVTKTLSESLLGFTRPFPDGIEVNLAESYEFRRGGRELIFKLREGVKWSDGHPFSADDILFWYEDMIMDENARAQGFFPSEWLIKGEPVRMEAVDRHTLRITSPHPMKQIPMAFAGEDMCAYPRHHFARLHPRYNPEASYLEFRRKTTPMMLAMDPEVPTLRAWRPVKWVRGRRIVYERNPYYWKVDTAGNQLPYIDRLTFTVVQDPRVIHLKFMNGEFDIFGRYGGSLVYPTLKAGEEAGNYRIFLASPGRPQTLVLNWDSPDPQLREALRDLRVRKALSHAVNREEIRDAIYFGVVLKPTGYGFSPLNPWYQEEDYYRYTAFDPAHARKLLEEAGYRDSDGDGYREFPDGRLFSLTIDYVMGKEESDIVEFVAGYWEDIGIKVHLNMGLANVIYSRKLNGLFDVYQNLADGAENPFARLSSWGIMTSQSPWWHRNAETEGPEWLHRVTELLRESMTLMDDAELDANMAQVRALHARHVPMIAIGELRKVWGASNLLGNVSGEVVSSDAFRGWGRPVAHEQLYFKESKHKP